MIGLLRNVCAWFKDLLSRDAGQELVEYGLLVVLLALGSLATIPPLATVLSTLLNAVTTAL